MGKNLIETNTTATAGQPIGAETLSFIQDAYNDPIRALIRATMGSYTTNDKIIFDGCLVTTGNPTAAGACVITAGYIYYNGNWYYTSGFNATITGSNVVVGTITTTDYVGPITFTDNNTYSVHEIKTIVLSQALTGSFDFSTFKYAQRPIKQTTSSNGQTIQVDISGSGPFAYNNDVYHYSYYITNRICHLSFKIEFDITDGAVLERVDIPLPSGIVKDTTAGEDYAMRGFCKFEVPTATSNYGSMTAYSDFGGAEGQRISLLRNEGSTSLTWETGKTVTLRGQISFPLA